MKNRTVLILLALLISVSPAKGDEGMWLLPLIEKLNIKTMKEIGFELSAKEIFHINKTSLKDAIIHFGGGCTGEVISPEGLILTNHHCGYSHIQKLSSVENDYLQTGFWAMNREQEIPAPGLSVTFLESFTDVTKELTRAGRKAKSEEEKILAKKEIREKLITKATKGNPHFNAQIYSMYGGNSFYLVVTKTYNDIRFVGAPPSSIGKFGADSDNWVWPRHTGDFALFRIYSDSNNNPANYSPNNTPYTPKNHLKISIAGVEQGDPAMIIGYPGRTSRFMTAKEVTRQRDLSNSIMIEARGIKQELMMEEMLADPKVRLQYASKYASSSNFWKKAMGMNETFDRLNVVERRLEAEKEFTNWVNRDNKRIAKYGKALDMINNSINQVNDDLYNALYFQETLNAIELPKFSGALATYQRALKSNDEAAIEKSKNDIIARWKIQYKDYSPELDRKVAKGMIKLYRDRIEPSKLLPFYKTIDEQFGGDVESYVDNLYDNSLFTSFESIKEALLDDPQILFNDPIITFSNSLSPGSRQYFSFMMSRNEEYQKGHKLYIAGQMEMKKGEALYPDANSTMRMTYGQVLDYSPRDAVHYNFVTTLEGVMEKEDPTNWEFEVPEKLKELHKARDYGNYSDKDGNMPVCFISNNDITGGNSGSPVLNKRGELIGCAFDGNWEAMSGDVIFEPIYQRCINVDTRYILFIIEKFGNAKHLIDEMTIVK